MPSSATTIRDVWRISPANSELEAVHLGLRDALASVRHNPSVSTHLTAALEYRRAGVLDRAYDHLEAAAAIDPHDPSVNDTMARTWRDWRMPGLGLLYAYRAVYASPKSGTARHTLATLLHALGRRKDAEAAYRQAAALDPSAWYAWQNLCALSISNGRTQDAIAHCQHATALRRESQKALGHERH